MLKRGLSEVVSMVLILLIVIISISIIWLFVQPFILNTLSDGDGEGKLSDFLACTGDNIRAVECLTSNGSYLVRVQRGEGDINISEIKVRFRDYSGRDFIFSNRTIPGEFGFSTYEYNLSDIAHSGITSADIAIVVGGNACGFSGLPVSCQEGPLSFECGNNRCDPGEELTCPEDCGQGLSSCEITKGIVYLDDFEDSCTRIRHGLINSEINPVPYLGFHSVGVSHISPTYALGARFHRIIISWHKVYDENGQFKQDVFDSADRIYTSNNMKILLTIKANDPDRSTCSFEIGGRSLDEKDSYPKNENEWTEYVKFVVDKYYVQPVNNEQEPVLAGIQLGNEWSHQFVVNTTDNPTCSPNLMDPQVKLDSMIKLMNLTYSAMQEAQQNLDPRKKRLPMLTFGITGVDNFALKRGFNLEDQTYDGYLENGIRINTPEDISENSVARTERLIVEGAPYYDYLDIHFRSNYYQDHGYIAQWIRDVWDDNGITGKGLSSTEYGGPFYFYTTDYQEYMIPASLSHSFFEGFDAIAWASWVPARMLSAAANFGLEAMTTFDGVPRQYARNGYRRFTNEASGYEKIRLVGSDTYVFLDSDNVVLGIINISENVPPIPLTYEQCSDGLDNDNDGLIDTGDDFCGDGYFNNNGGVDVEFNWTGIYF